MAFVNSIDAEFLDSRKADCSVSPATGNPRRLLRAFSPRAGPGLAKPRGGSEFVSIVKTANSASKHFGDLKYWAIDSAVTQLAASQQAADRAQSGLDSDLKAISVVDPTVVEAIEGEVNTLTDLARHAGVAYSSDDSAAGNALLSQAKSWVMVIDDHLDKIVEKVQQQALARRDASTRHAEFAVNWRSGPG